MSNPKCPCIPYLSLLKIVIVSFRLWKRGEGWYCRCFKVCSGRQLMPFCHLYFLPRWVLGLYLSRALWPHGLALGFLLSGQDRAGRGFSFLGSLCRFFSLGDIAVLRLELLGPHSRREDQSCPSPAALPCLLLSFSCHKEGISPAEKMSRAQRDGGKDWHHLSLCPLKHTLG